MMFLSNYQPNVHEELARAVKVILAFILVSTFFDAKLRFSISMTGIR